MLDAYRQGDYEAALREVEGLQEVPASYHFFRGGFLMQLARFDEAETALKNSLKLKADPKLSAIGWSTLGELRLQQRCYDEGIEFFSTSLKDWPEWASGHRHMAEAWLWKGNAGEALKWASKAVEMERSAPPPQEANARENYDYSLSEELATLAWAVAEASKDRGEVEQLVGEAVPLVGKRAAVPAAQVRYLSGRAYAALGESAKSKELFEEAASIDPHGMWGRASKKASAEETHAGIA
jgi:tetratricopeptide (TPR) repeat protein